MNHPHSNTAVKEQAIAQNLSHGEDGRVTTSYVFWCLGLMGVGGVHRLYNGKIVSGLLWLCTGGLFGVGQFIDLFLIPDMAESKRMKLLRASTGQSGAGSVQPAVTQTVTQPTREQLMVNLLEAARAHAGKLTVPQAVMATQLGFDQVEDLLLEMHRKGYVSMENDLETGVIVYNFVGL